MRQRKGAVSKRRPFDIQNRITLIEDVHYCCAARTQSQRSEPVGSPRKTSINPCYLEYHHRRDARGRQLFLVKRLGTSAPNRQPRGRRTAPVRVECKVAGPPETNPQRGRLPGADLREQATQFVQRDAFDEQRRTACILDFHIERGARADPCSQVGKRHANHRRRRRHIHGAFPRKRQHIVPKITAVRLIDLYRQRRRIVLHRGGFEMQLRLIRISRLNRARRQITGENLSGRTPLHLGYLQGYLQIALPAVPQPQRRGRRRPHRRPRGPTAATSVGNPVHRYLQHVRYADARDPRRRRGRQRCQTRTPAQVMAAVFADAKILAQICLPPVPTAVVRQVIIDVRVDRLHLGRRQLHRRRHPPSVDLARHRPTATGVIQRVVRRDRARARIDPDRQFGSLLARHHVQVAVAVQITQRHRVRVQRQYLRRARKSLVAAIQIYVDVAAAHVPLDQIQVAVAVHVAQLDVRRHARGTDLGLPE